MSRNGILSVVSLYKIEKKDSENSRVIGKSEICISTHFYASQTKLKFL